MSEKIMVSLTVHVTAETFVTGQFDGMQSRPKTMSVGQYGINRGLGRVLDVARENAIRCTFFVPGAVCEKYPVEISEIVRQGHEIACHGLNHENLAGYSFEEQLELLKNSRDIINRVTGVTPKGFRAPMHGDLTEDTLRALCELGFTYSSSLFDDDHPYRVSIAGEETGLLEIPIKWPLYDLPYFMLLFNPAFPAGQSRVAQYTRVLENWKAEYEGSERYNIPYILQVDTQTIAKPGRIGLLEEIIEFVRSRGTGEFMTLSDIAARSGF